MAMRQLPAAADRSAPPNSTCTSFSASPKVEGETSGPAAGAVPNAGGAPGGGSAGFCDLLLHAAVAPTRARAVRVTNCLRDFDIVSSERHCSRMSNPGLYAIGEERRVRRDF